MLRTLLVCALAGGGLFAVMMIPARAADKAAKSAGAIAAEAEAREHVHQALVAETLGDNAARARRLATAWLGTPDLAEANWHLGRVEIHGAWRTLAEAEELTASDEQLLQYRALRDKAENPRLLRALARWCTRAGWDDVAKVHYAQLLSRSDADPELRAEAIKKLDLRQVDGGWITGEELAARTQAAKSMEDAIARWRPKLQKLQAAIESNDRARRDHAIEELAQFDDPAIIPAVQSLLPESAERFQEEAVKRLAKFPHYEATRALVGYAVLSSYASAKDGAVAALKKRPLHEYVPLLLGGLVAPIKSQFQVTWDAKGKISYTHALLREGSSGNLLLLAHELSVPQHAASNVTVNATVRVPLSQPAVTKTSTTVVGTPPQEAFAEQLAEATNLAANAETQVRLVNSAVGMSNGRLFEVLEGTTSEHLSREPARWWTWWQEYNEYQWPKPTLCYWQSNSSYYSSGLTNYTYITGTRHTSCFVAGTLVHTETGLVPVENLRAGDRVLAQDQDAGELAYKLVLHTTLRPPSKLVRIVVGSDKIVTTLGHPFWVDGHGWKMAKQLKEGDLLHSLGGAVRVESVETLAQEKEAYNLVVDDFNTYFVGQQALLVHDNEFRKPTRAIVPGLVADESASK